MCQSNQELNLLTCECVPKICSESFQCPPDKKFDYASCACRELTACIKEPERCRWYEKFSFDECMCVQKDDPDLQIEIINFKLKTNQTGCLLKEACVPTEQFDYSICKCTSPELVKQAFIDFRDWNELTWYTLSTIYDRLNWREFWTSKVFDFI